MRELWQSPEMRWSRVPANEHGGTSDSGLRKSGRGCDIVTLSPTVLANMFSGDKEDPLQRRESEFTVYTGKRALPVTQWEVRQSERLSETVFCVV